MSTTLDNPYVAEALALNALLRGETAAVAAYTQALAACDDPEVIIDLQKIRDDHSRAVRLLRDRVVRCGGRPEDAGAWGHAALPGADGSNAGCPTTALAALRQSEELCAGEYEATMTVTDLDADCHQLIRADLLPACRNHVDELNRLLGGMNH